MTARDTKWRAGFPIAVGLVAIVLMLVGFGAWGVGTQIAGAVVAEGVVEVQSDRQVIQHPDGGVVGEILARDGDWVDAGAVLLRLDGTFLQSELSIVEGQLAEIYARSARLAAELDEAAELDLGRPPEFRTVSTDTVTDLVEGQRTLFDARRRTREQERLQLQEQQRQIEAQMEGMGAQLTGLRRQQQLVDEELEGIRALFERGLVESAQLNALEREHARLQGQIGNLTSMLAEAETRITGLEIEQLRLDESRREDAIAQLRDLDLRKFELEERRLSLLERIARLDVRAPVSGTVFASEVVAEQSVVQPAERMMYIVPGDQPLHVIARIEPIDVEQVFPGQDVALMFTTFSRRTTPEIPGTLLRVSADVETDQVTGERFYRAIIQPDMEAMAQMPELVLLPGMPVETFLKTGDRTPFSYITQPLTIYFERAFRED